MQKLILATLLFSSFAHALEVEHKAVVRVESGKARIETVTLMDLVSDRAFDGEHFMVVKGKGKCSIIPPQKEGEKEKEVCVDEPVSFDADEATLLRASTTYYHLTKARDYFQNHLKSDYVKSMEKVVIRIEHQNQFSELGHFANNNLEPQFNNALTVPAGKGLASRNVTPWGLEIWFRPVKRVNLNDLQVNNLQAKEFKALLSGFRNQIHMQSLSRFLSSSVTFLTQASSGASSPFSLDSLIRTAGSSLVMEAGYIFIDPITKATSRQWYWLDTAMIPEIIYHEYAHAALSDYLVLSHSTAIIEGMADFFAGQIAKSPTLAKKIKKYNTFNGKDAKRKKDYQIEFELGEYANTDFVFGLLWEMKNILGEEKGESFMFDLRKNLNTNSSIRNGLVEGLIKTCKEECSDPFNDRIRILKALNLRGI